jgi:hypothetical protein
MTAPVFDNASEFATINADTSLLLILPTRTNGNLLIGVVSVSGDTPVTWPTGWTPLDSETAANNGGFSYAYCYVTDSEVAPTVTWTGIQNARGVVVQYSGAAASSPIGAQNKTQDFGFGEISMTNPGVTTTAVDSAVCILGNFVMCTAPPTIAGYAQKWVDPTGTAFALYDVALSTLGSASAAISLALGSFMGYQTFGFEILAVPDVPDVPDAPAPPTTVKGAKGYRIIAGPSGPEHTFRTVSVQGTGPSKGLSLGNQETNAAGGEYETVYAGPTGASGFPMIFVDGYTGPA